MLVIKVNQMTSGADRGLIEKLAVSEKHYMLHLACCHKRLHSTVDPVCTVLRFQLRRFAPKASPVKSNVVAILDIERNIPR